MKICTRIKEIEDFFTVKGGYIEDIEIVIGPGNIKRVNHSIDPEKLKMESFNPTNSKSYNFITFNIK